MIARDGKWFQQCHQIGFDGKPANVREMQIDYVIGSGNHVRSYLHRNAEGKLVELPVSWYSEKNGYWAMSQGYDLRTNPISAARFLTPVSLAIMLILPTAMRRAMNRSSVILRRASIASGVVDREATISLPPPRALSGTQFAARS